ncbi:glycoside hydrolase family 6 protein [Plantactinospora siamensis]|uniref:Glucanase n=1 Tax=Plantactinospora siamensis TaxID=555372 RepID=A0ABV6NRZ1_9ACTN
MTGYRLLRSVMAALLTVTIGGCAADRGGEPSYAPLRHPFRGARLFLDTDTLAADWQQQHRAGWLDPIVRTPQVRWVTGPEDVPDLVPMLAAARRQHALPVLALYWIPDLDCSGGGAPNAGAYDRWIRDVVRTLGDTRSAIVLEPDAVASDCFDKARAALLTRTVRTLAEAHHYVYLDAGHSRWNDPAETGRRLRKAGIDQAEGFAVNVSNRQPTAASHSWAVEVSKLVGDREAVIDTSRNGLPPPADDDWCNTARQGLGRPPTTDPGLDRVAALLWVKNPGETDGPCGDDRSNGVFVPAQARTLIMNASWLPAAARRAAATADAPAR